MHGRHRRRKLALGRWESRRSCFCAVAALVSVVLLCSAAFVTPRSSRPSGTGSGAEATTVALAAARKRRHAELCASADVYVVDNATNARHHDTGPSLILVGDEFAEVLPGRALWLDAALGVPPGGREVQRRADVARYWRSTVANALRGYVEEPRKTASLAMGGDSSFEVAARLRSCAGFPRPPAPGTAQVFVVVIGSHELAAGLRPGAARRFAAAASDIVTTILGRNPGALVLLQPPLPLPVAPAQAAPAAAARYAATATLWALQQPGRVHVLSCAAAATMVNVTLDGAPAEADEDVDDCAAAAHRSAGPSRESLRRPCGMQYRRDRSWSWS